MLLRIIFNYIATIAFAIFFNAPKKDLLPIGLVGTIGFVVYAFMFEVLGYSSMLSNFTGTVLLSLCSEIFARIYKEPVTIFSVSGIIPLVPGLALYRAGSYFMMDAYAAGMERFLLAFLDAVAIALGVLLVSSLARACKRAKTIYKVGRA